MLFCVDMVCIKALAIITTIGAVQLPSAFAQVPTGCTGDPHDTDSGPTGDPHDPGDIGNPHDPHSHHHEGADICPGAQ